MTTLLDALTEKNTSLHGEAHERRAYKRCRGGGMSVELAGRRYSVFDVSVGGLCIEAFEHPVGENVRIVVSVLDASAVSADCRVVEKKGNSMRLEFTRPTLPLLRLVIAHISLQTGAKPHLLRLIRHFK